MRVQVLIFALFVSSTIAATCTLNSQIPAYTKCDAQWNSKLIAGQSFCSAGAKTTIIAATLTYFSRTINGQVATPGVLHDYLSATSQYSSNQFWFLHELMNREVNLYGPAQNFGTLVPQAICDQKLVLLNFKENLSIAKSSDANGVNAIDSDGKTTYLPFSQIKSVLILRTKEKNPSSY